MNKILLGLPIVAIGIIVFFAPYMLFGDAGMEVFKIILLIVSLCALSWVIGDVIKDR